MQITHHGHACLLIETDDARILIDPGVLSEVDTIGDLDAVLITHQHADHIEPDRLRRILSSSPGARLVVDPDTASTIAHLPQHSVVTAGDRVRFGSTTVDVLGGIHAPVYGDIPGCTNCAFMINDGAVFHPGDSFHLPTGAVDALAVAIDGPWLKLAEAIEYILTVSPRLAIPIHEGETTDPAKIIGMLDGLTGGNTLRRLVAGQPTTV